MGQRRPPSAGQIKSFDDLDYRTSAARRAKELVADLQADLGGASAMTTAQRELAHRAALCSAIATTLEVRWIEGGEIDLAAYASLVNSQRRLLSTLGIKRLATMLNGHVANDPTDRIVRAIRTRRHA